jgi:hypothetical protein
MINPHLCQQDAATCTALAIQRVKEAREALEGQK